MSQIERAWRKRGVLACVLWPISVFYGCVIRIRRIAYKRKWIESHDVLLPVVVVGNISVGGTGKSPLCTYLVQQFEAAGWRPAIVSRGYGGIRRELPHLVNEHNSPKEVGDEPLMLHNMTGVPVCVCVKRAMAVNYLAEHTDANIVIADDGLQHLAMPRDADIVVLDGKRGLGNGWLLPAGPLREPARRLNEADIVVVQGEQALHDSLRGSEFSSIENSLNNHRFTLSLSDVVSLSNGRRVLLSSFRHKNVIAIAGIGDPQRFFDALRAEGLNVKGIPKPDHHSFSIDDVDLDTELPVLVTSKDAVKLKALGQLPVDVFEVTTVVRVSDGLQSAIDGLERSLNNKFHQ